MNYKSIYLVILIITLCINGCIKHLALETKRKFIDEIVYIPSNEYRAIEIIGLGDGIIQFDAKEINGKNFWAILVSSSDYEKILCDEVSHETAAAAGVVEYATAINTYTYKSENISLKKGLYYLYFETTNRTAGTLYDLNIDLKVYQVE